MTIELPTSVEEQLRDLAKKQGRGVDTVVEEAVREYLVAASITDLDSADIGEAQMTLAEELRDSMSGRVLARPKESRNPSS